MQTLRFTLVALLALLLTTVAGIPLTQAADCQDLLDNNVYRGQDALSAL